MRYVLRWSEGFDPISAAFHWSRTRGASARAAPAPILNLDSLRPLLHLLTLLGQKMLKCSFHHTPSWSKVNLYFVYLFVKKRKVYCCRTWLTCVQEACRSCNEPTLRSLVGMTWLTCAQEVLLPLQLTYVCWRLGLCVPKRYLAFAGNLHLPICRLNTTVLCSLRTWIGTDLVGVSVSWLFVPISVMVLSPLLPCLLKLWSFTFDILCAWPSLWALAFCCSPLLCQRLCTSRLLSCMFIFNPCCSCLVWMFLLTGS